MSHQSEKKKKKEGKKTCLICIIFTRDVDLYLPSQVMLSEAFNRKPFGHAHLYLPWGANKQRWLQPPFFMRHGGLFIGDAKGKKEIRRNKNREKGEKEREREPIGNESKRFTMRNTISM